MPLSMLVPGRGDITLGVTFLNAGVPGTTTFLGIAGPGDMCYNTSASATPWLYLCVAATSSALTWQPITMP
jgi:hypothetical protein